MLGNFSYVLSSAESFQFHFPFSKISFRNATRVSNSFAPDQARHIVRPNPGRNCLQMLSTDDSSKQRVKVVMLFGKVNFISICQLPKSLISVKVVGMEFELMTPLAQSLKTDYLSDYAVKVLGLQNSFSCSTQRSIAFLMLIRTKMLYSATCLKRSLKNRQNKGLKPCGILMQVISTAEYSIVVAVKVMCVKL